MSEYRASRRVQMAIPNNKLSRTGIHTELRFPDGSSRVEGVTEIASHNSGVQGAPNAG
jgi:hypothetical protein